jgi:hypothetical protein
LIRSTNCLGTTRFHGYRVRDVNRTSEAAQAHLRPLRADI